MIALALLGTALAQTPPDVVSNLYRMPLDAERTLWTDDASLGPAGFARLQTHYLRGPLALHYEDGRELSIIGDAVSTALAAGFSFGRIRLGAELPLWMHSTSDLDGYGGGGLGQVSFDAKATLLDPATAPLGLAIAGRVGLPTATTSLPLDPATPTWDVRAIVDKTVGPVLLAANVGVVDGPTGDFELGDALLFRLGSGFALTDAHGLSLELAGQAAPGVLDAKAMAPVEMMGGGYARFGDSLVLRGGVGTGLNIGVGAPAFRAVLALTWQTAEPEPEPEPVVVEAPAPEVVPEPPPEPEPPARVVVTREEIEIAETVYFDTEEATIRPESFPLLDEIAQVLQDNPQILRVRVEGHTDSRGTDAFNLDLSERRAAAVVAALVQRGIAADRLESAGHGESRPLDATETEEAWRLNRRVELHILERDDQRLP